MVTMKKRMLALALALTMIVGLGGHAWAEVLPDLVSPSPEVSAQPEDSASPEVSETPEETTAPEETDVPEETDTPEETTSPEETEAPAETEAPEETEEPQDSGTQEEPSADVASNAAPLANANPIDTVSPVGTTINLFDYWYSSRDENADSFDASITSSGWPGSRTFNYHNWATGINMGHALKFYGSAGNHLSKGNAYTDSSQPYAGMVQSVLVNGYPALNSDTMTGSITRNTDGHLLDDEDEVRDYNIQFDESLAYLFNPSTTNNSRDTYTDVKGLLSVSDDGYYIYDCTQNFAEFHQETNSFTVYDQPNSMGLKNSDGSDRPGQFFPFNSYENGANETLNYFMGLTMTTRFVQKDGGTTANGSHVTYEFSGDDDVWVFIDGVLVGDLGGIHDASSLKIDFSTGEVLVNDAPNGTLKSKFEAAGKSTDVGFTNNTFADNTYHTLQFFYLERGAGASNMKLKFNLVSVPESSIYKVDQTGSPVSGAGFELHAATQTYEERALIADGTTDSAGQIILLDDEGFTISFQDLWNKLESANLVYQEGGLKRANLLLKETSTPSGYRSGNIQKLYLVRSGNNIMMLSDDPWSNGTYSYTNSTISMNGIFTADTGTDYNLKNGGTLFAVVLRRDKNDTPENDDWYLMTGSATDGWKQSEKPVSHNIAALLAGVKENSQNYYVMRWDPSGAYKTTVTNLPGDIMKYYYMLDEAHRGDAEYSIAFYYTTAPSVGAADENNTWMVRNTAQWTREFSSNVYVPNVKNRLFVQKLSPAGDGVEGAVFELYGDDYYTGDGTTVNPDAEYIFRVTTQNLEKDSNGNGINLSGAAVFPTSGNVLPTGTYYLVEASAPSGYDVNPVVTKVVVDDTGVYADAGRADDGVVVSRGVGSIVKSMAQFASLGDIDVTLNNVVAKFYTVNNLPASGDFANFQWRDESLNPTEGVDYHPTYWENTDGTYALYDAENRPEGAMESGMHLNFSAAAALEYGTSITMVDGQQAVTTMRTDTGWSKLMMEQCYDHSQALAEGGKNVTDLSGYDLTNLFSGTVIVQVTDPHSTSITINKQVNGVTADDVATQTYTFTVTKKNADNTGPDANYAGTVQVKVGDTQTEQQFSGGVLTVSRQGVGEIQVLNLEDGVYEVTETGHGAESVTSNGVPTFWQRVEYQVAGETQNVVTINDDAPETAVYTVTATNYYQANRTLTVTKTVTGNMGDTTLPFGFTFTLTKGSDTYTQPVTATLSGGDLTEGQEQTLTYSNDAQSYSFQLKHSQQIAIDVPYGYQVTLTETAVPGYMTTANFSQGTGTVNGNTATVTMTDVAKVDYTNNCAEVTPTGVQPPSEGFSVMLGVAGASAVLIFGCSFLVWRRRRRDWM